jgi:ribosomal protein S12 methylthiotransferase
MIDAIAECERVCKYVDIPLQHIHDRVLKAMHRRVDRRETESLLGRIRRRIPGVAIRTTMIAGFPGETEAEFDELVQFIRDFRFDALGVFPYSLEPDTPAGRMKEQVSQKAKEERVEALMLAQQEVAFALAEEKLGRELEVLVDERSPDGTLIARHQGQAPMVDSVTRLVDADAEPGEFLVVRGLRRQDYDLVARPVRRKLAVLSP